MVLGALAMAAGAGDAGDGHHDGRAAGRDRAASSPSPAAQESSADQAGAKYLPQRRRQRQGHARFLRKLQNQEYRLAVYAKDSYDRTHPLSSERIQALRQVFEKDPAWNRPPDPALEARFQRVKAKLLGFVEPEAGGHQISRERPERPGALRPGLRLSCRRLPRQSAVGGRRAAQGQPRTIPSSSS